MNLNWSDRYGAKVSEDEKIEFRSPVLTGTLLRIFTSAVDIWPLNQLLLWYFVSHFSLTVSHTIKESIQRFKFSCCRIFC
jgi:hypothetical protein